MGPMLFRPQTAGPLFDLAEVLLRGKSTLSRGEREVIAAYVFRLNQCLFYHSAHSTFAALQLDGGTELVEAVLHDPDTAQVSGKMRALLRLAALVAQSGLSVVTPPDQTGYDDIGQLSVGLGYSAVTPSASTASGFRSAAVHV